MLAFLMTIENDSDRDKVTEIYQLYHGTMLYVANSILKENHLAEDAVSEAFIKIIDNLEKINEIDCYRTRGFVVIIVRNTALDMLRKQKKEQTIPLEENENYQDCKEPALDSLSAKEVCDKITGCIAKLNKTYSDILYIKVAMDCSCEEIAKILGISPANAKMRLCRARKALIEELKKEGELL